MAAEIGMYRTCKKCGETKLTRSDFHLSGHGGYRYECKVCVRRRIAAREKVRYHSDPEYRQRRQQYARERAAYRVKAA